MYAMLFPIVTIPFLGERRNKRFFLEKNNNEVIEREIIDRVYINGKDKLILKMAKVFKLKRMLQI